MHPGQKIHSSFLLASGEGANKYIPKARPYAKDKDFWGKLRDDSEYAGQWLEVDLYESTQAIVEKYITGPDSGAWQRMCEIATSGKTLRFIPFFLDLTSGVR
jgi:hypothetical protein